jgi:hypothetical protein
VFGKGTASAVPISATRNGALAPDTKCYAGEHF